VADRFMAQLGGWARRNMDALFAVARNLAPILVVTYRGKTFVLVSRHDDVREVMSLPNVFRVPYASKFRVIMGGGNIFLGMHDEPDFTRDKSTMRVVVPREEARTRVKPEVERLAAEIVDKAGGRLDVAMELTQAVTTRFFGRRARTRARRASSTAATPTEPQPPLQPQLFPGLPY
jgi:cytochrome P450